MVAYITTGSNLYGALFYNQEKVEKGVGRYLRRNDTGRIVRVTFIDHENRCVLNGSRLGKEYSANALNERYTKQQNTPADLHRASEAPAQQKTIRKQGTARRKRKPNRGLN